MMMMMMTKKKRKKKKIMTLMMIVMMMVMMMDLPDPRTTIALTVKIFYNVTPKPFFCYFLYVNSIPVKKNHLIFRIKNEDICQACVMMNDLSFGYRVHSLRSMHDVYHFPISSFPPQKNFMSPILQTTTF